MQSDLLKKEDEFYRENEKLEQRTKELMKKVNDVMKIQDNLIKDTLRMEVKFDIAKINHCNVKEQMPSEHLNSNEEINNKDLNIPSTVNDMGKKGIVHFYRAKIKCLQEENTNLHSENKKKNEEIKKLQKENQIILEEKEKWFTSYNSVKTDIGKLESQISSFNLKLQSKDCEIQSLRKEVEQVKKELKYANLNLNNIEVRLNRAYEENDKLKVVIKSIKDEEKETRECCKKQINDLTLIIKRMEQQKSDLLNGFRKQLQLIDNLKKQKVYFEGYKMAELTESEYLKILDWKLD